MKNERTGAGARAILIKNKSSRSAAGAMFMKRRAPERELFHSFDGSTVLDILVDLRNH